jgi:hypothetical protein
VTIVLTVTFIGIVSTWLKEYTIVFCAGIFLMVVAVLSLLVFLSIPEHVRRTL